jgi:hypothetical protein
MAARHFWQRSPKPAASQLKSLKLNKPLSGRPHATSSVSALTACMVPLGTTPPGCAEVRPPRKPESGSRLRPSEATQ